jgi:hypothetical protein
MVLVLALLGQSLAPRLLPAQTGSGSAVQREIARLDSVWMIGAHTTPRSPDWFAVLDAGFIRTGSDGAFEDRAQLLHRLLARPADSGLRYALRDVIVRVAGAQAQSTGRFLITDSHGRLIAQSPYRNGYVRRAGQWLVLTSHWGL